MMLSIQQLRLTRMRHVATATAAAAATAPAGPAGPAGGPALQSGVPPAEAPSTAARPGGWSLHRNV